MGLSGIISYPYSQARCHFVAAPQSTIWGGYAVHYLAGSLELIPIFNYLVLLVDLVVSRILTYLANYIFAQPTLPVDISVQTFFQNHQIQINPSPLPEQKPLGSLNSAFQNVQRPVIQSLDDYLQLLGFDNGPYRNHFRMHKSFFITREILRANGLQDLEQEGYFISKRALHTRGIKSLSEGFFVSEEALRRRGVDLQQQKLFIHENALRQFGLENLHEGVFVSTKTLGERGIKDLQDIDCLKLRQYDQMELDLVLFEAVLEKEFDRLEIQEAYQKCLKRVVESYTTTCTTAFDKFKKRVSDYLQNKNFKQVKAITDEFKVIYRLDQTRLLLTYLRQNNILNVWESIKTSNPDWTLQDYCSFHKIAGPSQLYQLGAAFTVD